MPDCGATCVVEKIRETEIIRSESKSIILSSCRIVTAGGGAPGGSTSLPTNSAIGGNRAISTKDQFACYADADDSTVPAVGLSVGAVASGNDVQIQSSGLMEISGAGFTPNNFVFVGVNGTLTQTPTQSGFFQKIGIAHTSEVLLINISQPIFL